MPPGARVAGWAALVHGLSLAAPVRRPSCVSEKHIRGSQREEGGWRVFDKRYWPGTDFADHLVFALRHEGLDLLVLKRAFEAVSPTVVEEMVRAAPTGASSRCIWFLYEWLLDRRLNLPDAPTASAIDLLDPESYFTAEGELSRRHRVRNNLLGTPAFCPVIRRTETLNAFVERKLADKARDTIGRTGGHLVSRAASFMLLADSRASFEIEGERPPRNRIERWGRAILQAGSHSLSVDEITRLHRILIEDSRFVQVGIRPDGVYLGERDRFGDPLPEFIGARPDDLCSLLDGLIAANNRMGGASLDPVLQAAVTAFGFVYIHPLQDGNGRLHRLLIHHVLSERKFSPPGMVFPVSSVMLDRIDDYRETLRADTGPLMPFIQWRPTPDRNVEVLNDTADFYRYVDFSAATEFLCGCVAHTVDHDLPREIDYLRRHDEAMRRLMDTVEMPDRLAEDLIMFIRQNGGTLSKRRREGVFKTLEDDEVARLQEVVREAFEGFEDKPLKGASTRS
ncbi:Fic family protein [Fodinicurvata sp. EGI_FJ10296]|uniref:Fic family protein n=1 Tax=Fodinicurvata sp. EGI_FJ10296 TaxID=3231908 RepID=UPI0034551BAD